jgi:4-amino-4-deoxy-L-arabinose transferase-like glycosyltransferase
MSARRWWWCLGVILIVALALRLALALATPLVLFGDPNDYQRHAVSIATTGHFPSTELASPGTPSAFRPPAFPYLLGGLYAVVGIHPNAGRVLEALLGTLTVALLGLMGREVWSRRVGLIAAGLGAVYPALIGLNASLLSESLFLPLELGFLLSLVMCVRSRGRVGWAVLTGGLCGLGVLTRAVADAWVLVAIAAAALAVVGARLRLRQGLAVLASFLIVLTPWLIRDAVEFHQFVPVTTESGFTLAGQYNVDAGTDDSYEAVQRLPTSQVLGIERQVLGLLHRPGGINEAQLDGVLRSDALHYLRAHPAHLAVAVWLDSLRMFDLGRAHVFTTSIAYREMNLPSWMRRPTTIFAQLAGLIAVLTLLVWALAHSPLRRRSSWLRAARDALRLGPWWLWAIPVLTVVFTVPSVGNELKRAPLDPFLVLLVALAIDAGLTVLGRRPRVLREGIAD